MILKIFFQWLQSFNLHFNFYELSDLNMFLYGFKIIELYDNERIDKCFLGTSYNSGTTLHIF